LSAFGGCDVDHEISLCLKSARRPVDNGQGPGRRLAAKLLTKDEARLAAGLWNNGISFGGVVAFIFADLIVLPILDIYRKYYGLKMTGFLLATFYIAMAVAALIVEAVFAGLGLIPTERQAQVVEASVSWSYTTWLNIVFLILAALLVRRFMKTGGPEMLRIVNAPAEP
jgi:uncharacterized membrane protein YraQ (UPF0718 family)